MPVLDPAAIAGIISDLLVNIASYAGMAAILYAIGGILIRTVSWTFDKMLISFIGMFYKYFEMIIDGTLLTDDVVISMMNRVYLLVGVFVAFRLGMLLINYIINPSEVMDEKVGVNALIKRVILGLILIIFMPNIFGFAFRLQKAILSDEVIERIIMSDEEMQKVNEYKKKHGMGKIIGMTVFQGFFNLTTEAANNNTVKKNYNKATMIDQDYDLSVIDSLGSGLSGGILYEVKGEYAHDYFPIFSSVVLCFVLYMLVQYCLDAVVRSLKLSVLQVIAPICIVEYMINSDRNEVFKSWRKAVISTFAMLFMRVASIWFVAYVAMLMQPGMIDGSSLLQTKDYLLKAIIVLGLLAFMMDFPKMMSDVFGLDLDQSGAVKGVMGKALGAATAGLAIGGAAVGFGMKAAGGGAKALSGGLRNMKRGDGLKGNLKNFGVGTAAAAKKNHLGAALKGGLLGVGSAVMASNSVTGSVSKGYGTVKESSKRSVDEVKGKEAKEQAAQDRMEDISRETENRRQDILRDNVKSQIANNPGANKQDIIDSVINTTISAKLNGQDIGSLAVDINGNLKSMQDSGLPVLRQDIIGQVQEVVGSKLGTSTETVTQVVNQVLGDSNDATPTQVEQIVSQVVQSAKDASVPEVTQVVNQAMGTVVNSTVSDATQKVNQVAGNSVDTKVDTVTQTVQQELNADSLLDGKVPGVIKNSNGEYEVDFSSLNSDG